jgi:hypothetical protein
MFKRMKSLNKELRISNLQFVEQKFTTQGIKMFRRVEPVLVTRQEIVVLLKVELTIAKGVLVAIKEV